MLLCCSNGCSLSAAALPAEPQPATPRGLAYAKFDELNRHVFAFAAYNAWRKIGRETVDYVRNILKYWVAYHLALDPDEDVQRPAA